MQGLFRSDIVAALDGDALRVEDNIPSAPFDHIEHLENLLDVDIFCEGGGLSLCREQGTIGCRI